MSGEIPVINNALWINLLMPIDVALHHPHRVASKLHSSGRAAAMEDVK